MRVILSPRVADDVVSDALKSYEHFGFVDLNTHQSGIVTHENNIQVTIGTQQKGKIYYDWLRESGTIRFLGEYDLLTGQVKIIYEEPVRNTP